MTLSKPGGRGTASVADVDAGEPSSTLEIRNARSGRTFEVPIADGAIRARDLGQIQVGTEGARLLSYDPAFLNTASCRSAITYIDGDRGVLLYRGYPIEELAAERSFLDVAWLLIHGELPTASQSRDFAEAVGDASALPQGIIQLVQSFPRGAHPMAILLSAVAALGAYHPEAKAVDDRELRAREVPAFLGTMASLLGVLFRHGRGRSLQLPAPTTDYAHTIAANLFADGPGYTADPAIVRAIDVLLILQADHEQNCSTNAVRAIGSSRVDPWSAFVGGIAALYGPLHGGANEAVMAQLREVGSVEHAADVIRRAKTGEHKLMGFGHRIYKNYDPRARIIKRTAEDVFAVTGTNPLLDVAIAIEQAALSDDYFVSRRLYPNVDFYSGLIYEALGLPTDMFTVFFAVSRMAGWTAQWLEMIDDPEQKIARPRQLYVGHARRDLPGA
ncbi:MAG TPA: citrate/2-methylcitrate synthase [Candidatus Saccharimonadales bacterium]|nr:citrate/2-methylcitrate synthase [Candidatus Saccharimonadales bacterium]